MNEKIRFEWNLGNSCSFNCTYCHIELKDGRNPFPNLDRLIPAFAHLKEQTRDFLSVQIEITGGEPSESEALRFIIENNTDERIKFKLISNASADLQWWKSIKNSLYGAQLTYHNISNFDHFFDVVQELKKINPRLIIPLTPETWMKQKQVYDILRNLNFDVHLQMLYSNFTRGNNQYLKYTQEQWNEYYHTQGVDPTKKDQVVQTIEFKRVHNLNNFFGHLCWAGVDQLVIDNFGDVWRGWCKADGPMGNIYNQTINLDRHPRVCPRSQCKNGFDLQARKSENSWGIA